MVVIYHYIRMILVQKYREVLIPRRSSFIQVSVDENTQGLWNWSKWDNRSNKLFKSDSQRVAFSTMRWFNCLRW